MNEPKQATMTASPTGALRDNKGKPPVSWVPYVALEAIASVLWRSSEAGGGKYKKHNWRKGAPYSVPLDSLIRHAMKRADGETHDTCPADCEGHGQPTCKLHSRLPHSWHIICNAAFLVFYEKKFPDMDDLKPTEGGE